MIRCRRRDQQAVAEDAALGEAVDLRQQNLRVDHHAVPDHRRHARGQHPRRQQVQRVTLLADDYRVPGVVTPLVPDHEIHTVAEQVGRLAFALVTPLRPHQHDGGM
jgi:hypothetical protein